VKQAEINPDFLTSHSDQSYDFSEQIGHLLRRAYQRHLSIFQAHSVDPNLTSTQFVTLCALRDNGPVPQAELIRTTGIDQTTIRGIVERLVRRGLVQLQSDETDRRKTIVALTPDGAALLAEMVPQAKLISDLTMGDLNPGERAAIMFTLRKMISD